MKKGIVSLIVALSLFAGQAKAQDTLMVVAGGQIFNIPDTTSFGDTASYYFYIQNISSSSYFGYIILQTMVDSGSGPIFVQADSLQVFLNPGDSMPVSLFETYTPQDYRLGGNIVVIWPAAQNAFFLNTTNQYVVFIDGYMSVGDISGKGFSVYPVPFKNSLHIVMETGEDIPEKIKLRDIAGRIVFEAMYSELAIFPEEISTGTYFLELQFSDSSSKMVRLIKTK